MYRVLLLFIGAILCIVALALPIVCSVLNYWRATREQARRHDEAERATYRSLSRPTNEGGGFVATSSPELKAKRAAVNGQVTD